jgi:hypothetical protein
MKNVLMERGYNVTVLGTTEEYSRCIYAIYYKLFTI